MPTVRSASCIFTICCGPASPEMRLIKPALDHAGILPRVVVGIHRAERRRLLRCDRRRRRNLLRAGLNCRSTCGRLLLGLRRRLAVGDEFCIAGSARSRRHIGGHAAGPMRPMIGDKAAAARETKSKSEQSCRCNEPPKGHKAAGSLVRKGYIPTRRDGYHSWRDYGAEIVCALTIWCPEMPFCACLWR